ncbi:MAG: DUF4198 domain-containing protein [Wenzhouxiangella sp.]
MRNTLKAGTIALVLGIGLSGVALAHYPWVLTEPGRTEVGASVQVLPFFGHDFPFDDPMRPDRIAELVLLSADGERIDIDPSDANTPPLSAGVHVVGLRQARGYWSQTTEGGRPQPRSELQNVLSCGYSDNGAKTLIIVGDGGPSAAGQALGHRLEILTDADVGRLAAGDSVEFRVLLEGKPHAGPVMAFHANSGEDPWLLSESDGNGRIEIQLEGSGPWMVMAQGEIDYPDPAVCDVERFSSSLSFGHTAF